MAPSLAFRGQPFDGDDSAGAFLQRVLADPSVEHVTVVVAWAKFSGLYRLKTNLESFRARGGTLRIILGIDEGGATRPGLLLAVKLFDEAFVFHDQAAKTFHPKIYLAESATEAMLLVGSSNATAGGLFSNYEGSLEAGFKLPDEAAEPALVGVLKYIETLLDDHEVCRRLTEDFVDQLMSNPRYRVSGTERRARKTEDSSGPSLNDIDVDEFGSTSEPDQGASLFGTSTKSKTSAPPLSGDAKKALEELEVDDPDAAGDASTVPPSSSGSAGGFAGPPPAGPTGAAGAPSQTPGTPVPPLGLPLAPVGGASPPPTPSPPTAPTPAVVESWTKVLPAGDAQHTPSGNLTHNLRLTKAGQDINWLTWFRQTFFAGAAWSQHVDVNGNLTEEADVQMDTHIHGVPFGPMTFTVSHAAHRESGQANHATVLRWGPLESHLQTNDYTGDTVTLERLSNGTFRLTIR